MKAYYNEFDKNAAAWLRELIKEGLITDGEVDERSIEDVLPADLTGFDRCHFFAGIGVWDYALNLAGFDGQVWTGSCPCQPFSSAGKREGTADERHLWPAFFHLISQCRPDTLFGEQVASSDGLAWLDIVHSDLEGIGYTIGAADLPAAGFGAPHRRQRLFFVADPGRRSVRSGRLELAGEAKGMQGATREQRVRDHARDGVEFSVMAHASSDGHAPADGIREAAEPPFASGQDRIGEPSGSGNAGKLGDSNGRRREQLNESQRNIQEPDAGRTNGFWSGAEWVYCNDPDDPKWRPIEPGTFPLVTRTPDRVALLRGYGNSIVPQVAQAFIESYLETR